MKHLCRFAHVKLSGCSESLYCAPGLEWELARQRHDTRSFCLPRLRIALLFT